MMTRSEHARAKQLLPLHLRRASNVHSSVEETRFSDDGSRQMSQSQQSRYEDMEDTMRVEEDGGVSIPTQDLGNGNTAVLTDQMKQIYHQHPLTNTDTFGGLWDLPVGPVYEASTNLHNLDINPPIAATYHQCCRDICIHWNCEPATCIPDEFRFQTPYSMALLFGLARLSCHTKLDLALGQTLVREAWQKRNPGLQPSPDQLRLVETKINPFDGRQCESTIQENVFGLLLADVRSAFQQACRKVRKQARDAIPLTFKSKKQKARDRKQNRLEGLPGMRAESSTQGNSRQGQLSQGNDMTFYSLLDREMAVVSAAPPNSPILTGVTLRDLPNVLHANVAGGAERHGQTQREDEGFHKPTRQEVHIARELSGRVEKLDMDSSKGLRARQMKRMKEGGLSGRRQGTGRRLPSERSKFDSMAPLHNTDSATGPAALDQLGKMRLTDDGLR